MKEMHIKAIYSRFIYNNFLRPSRLPYFDILMGKLEAAGYSAYSLKELIAKGDSVKQSDKKVLVLRHDIDTDPRTAWLMAQIEKKHGFLGTYYFRLSTANNRYMQLIKEMGHEVSYHYEEIASYSKKNKLRNRQQVEEHMESIRKMFADNLKKFRYTHKLECKTIASHGEWINANYLNMQNTELLTNTLRKDLGIELEAYDADFMMLFLNSRISDLGKPLWAPYSVEEAISSNTQNLYLLLHPRQWYTRVWCNLASDIKRLFETIKYKYFKKLSRWR